MTVLDLVHRVDGADVDELWQVYRPVFGDREHDAWADGMTRQAGRDGFRLVRARDEASGRLVGFSHGHTGERGQWWTDRVCETLAPAVADEWVGGHFELIELAVLTGHRRQGTGRALLEAVTAGLPHQRWLLATTADTEDPARRLYAALGWEVLGPAPEGAVVLGRSRDATPR